MGTFCIDCRLENHSDRNRWTQVSKIMVDSGSESTWIPKAVLERIGVAAAKRGQLFQMANGQIVKRDIGYAIIRVGERETTDEVVLAEPGDSVLLGARSLEGLALLVDAKNKRLVDGGPQPVIKAVVPGPIPPDKDMPPIFCAGSIEPRVPRVPHPRRKSERAKR
jgi:predicted aspartyl protease